MTTTDSRRPAGRGAAGVRMILTVLSAAIASTATTTTAYGAAGPTATFTTSDRVDTKEGHVALAWEGSEKGLEYEIQCAGDAAFTDAATEYHGMALTFFESGLTDGAYFYRIRARRPEGSWGPWSEPVELDCEHHSLTMAWSLFAAGGFNFLMIVLFVALNARNLGRFEVTDD